MDASTPTSPLLHEVATKNFTAAQKLIAAGVDVNAHTPHGTSVLHLALCVAQDNPELIKQLVAAGSAVNSPGEFILGTAILLDYPAEIIEIILRAGAEVNQTDAEHRNALVYAAQQGNLENLKVLLDYGVALHPAHAPCSIFDVLNQHPAGENNSSAVYKLLLNRGAGPVLFKAPAYKDVLSRCVQEGDAGFIELLLQHGAPINAELAAGETLLTMACRQGDQKIVSLTLRYGADSGQPAGNGVTPLMYAVRGAKISIVRLLLKARAKVTAKDPAGRTALQLTMTALETEVSTETRGALRQIIKLLAGAEKKPPGSPGHELC